MKKETFHLIIRFLVGLAASLLICSGMRYTAKWTRTRNGC